MTEDIYWNKETKEQVGFALEHIWQKIGIDVPENHDKIVEFCYNDIGESADPARWNEIDVAIALRRFIEKI